jgi:hypothetical protein
MGMTKLKKYQVEEDDNSNLSIVELTDNDHREDTNDAGEDKLTQENIKMMQQKIIKTELTQSEQQVFTKEQPIPRWQKNLQTYCNPSGRENDDNDMG